MAEDWQLVEASALLDVSICFMIYSCFCFFFLLSLSSSGGLYKVGFIYFLTIISYVNHKYINLQGQEKVQGSASSVL